MTHNYPIYCKDVGCAARPELGSDLCRMHGGRSDTSSVVGGCGGRGRGCVGLCGARPTENEECRAPTIDPRGRLFRRADGAEDLAVRPGEWAPCSDDALSGADVWKLMSEPRTFEPYFCARCGASVGRHSCAEKCPCADDGAQHVRPSGPTS